MPTPQPPDRRGVHHGRSYWLWTPDTQPPWPGMVILHGAGSSKENHADFARHCAASGWAAISFDQRGHGEGDDEMGGAAVGDVGRMARLLAAQDGVDPRAICVRGSSMGGFLAIHAAAVSNSIAAVIAICPADEELLRRGLRQEQFEMRVDRNGFDAWLGEHEIDSAIELLAGKPIILLHANGDDRVPVAVSERLYERAGEPRRLIVVPGGHHRSVQHDTELQSVALRWVERKLGR